MRKETNNQEGLSEREVFLLKFGGVYEGEQFGAVPYQEGEIVDGVNSYYNRDLYKGRYYDADYYVNAITPLNGQELRCRVYLNFVQFMSHT